MKRLLALGVLLVVAGGLLINAIMQQASPVYAEEGQPTASKRILTLNVDYTAYEWWLVRWKGNEITCRFLIDHEGLPTHNEIYGLCGKDFYNEWAATKPCSLTDPAQTTQDCKGMYLYQFTSLPAKKQVEVELALPQVYASIIGCDLQPPGNYCDSPPNLLLVGEEPLPNETVISIQGLIDGDPFICNGSTCVIPLSPTGQQGHTIEFWADSSFGDSSERFDALVRVLPQGDFMSPDNASSDSPAYYVDVLSSQWRGEPVASCSETWQSFPDVGGPPPWLSSPADPTGLYSATSLYYLAGMLIANGYVDASSCVDGGLQTPLTASACGLQTARAEVVAWQNQFDEEIYYTARDTGVPAQLLKNVFSRESQFWPGIYQNYKEAGLGQLTEKGADTVLLWNPSFFSQFCPLVLHQERCDLGFGNLKADEQSMLRGALVRKVNAACAECPAGIDLTQAEFSVQVFAEGLIGNCEQTGRIITNVTGRDPGQVSSYVDLWRFTLVNYNAGPGCLSAAVKKTFQAGQPLDWEHVSAFLDETCSASIDYVTDISDTLSGILPTPTSWVYPGQPIPQVTVIVQPTGTLQPTPRLTATPGPSPTPGPSSTPPPSGTGYPAPTVIPTLPYP